MKVLNQILISMFFISGCCHYCAAQCPPYTAARAVSIHVSPDDNLQNILNTTSPGTVIYLDDGVYRISSNLQITTDSITIRSKNGNRNNVIFDGNNGGGKLDRSRFTPEVVAIAASDVHLVDLTIRYARDHGIHIYPPKNRPVNGCVMHNLHVYDCGQQLIKVNSNGSSESLYWVDNGILEGSLIEFVDNSVMQNNGSYFYTGGIDVHGGEGWIVRWNHFRNIHRDGKLMEHAVHFWSRSRGTLVENNRFENVYRAVGFGMKQSADGLVRSYTDGAGESPYYDHIDGVIRNNSIFNASGVHLETGIELMNVLNVNVYNNTVVSIDNPFNAMEYRWPNTKVYIVNNLCSHRIMQRNSATALALRSNITNATKELFVNMQEGDLHLVETAVSVIDKGDLIESAGTDIDGEARGTEPDIGADEYNCSGIIVTQLKRSQVQESENEAAFFTLLGVKCFQDRPFRRNTSANSIILSIPGRKSTVARLLPVMR